MKSKENVIVLGKSKLLFPVCVSVFGVIKYVLFCFVFLW